jgi:paraquat-inducible protein B
MGRRANPTLIGAFIVGAALLVVMGLLIFGRSQFFSEQRTYVLYFDGSVKGLNVGAPVDFQGVRIGTVTDIKVQVIPQTNEVRTPVYIQIERDRVGEVDNGKTGEERQQFLQALIQRGLRAQLETQSLVTGQLIVQLGFYPDTPIRLVSGDPAVPEMPTIPTTLQQAQAAAQNVLERIQQLPLDQLFASFMEAVQGTNRLVNAPEVLALVRSANDTMTDIQQLVDQVDNRILRVLDEVGGASAGVQTLMTDVQQLVRHVDSRVVPLAGSAKDALDAARATVKDGQQMVRHVDGRVMRLADSLAETAKTAQTTVVQTQKTLDNQLVALLQELTSAARSVRLLADYLERNPTALLYGKGGDRR